MSKIMVGYGTGKHSTKKGLYGKKTGGKFSNNGGFNGEPTVTFENISDERWDEMFPDGYKPHWLKNA